MTFCFGKTKSYVYGSNRQENTQCNWRSKYIKKLKAKNTVEITLSPLIFQDVNISCIDLALQLISVEQ